MDNKFTKYSGNKFGHLTLLHYLRPGGQGKGAIWLALCDCGSKKEVVAKDIRAGRVKTCGNCELTRRLMASRGPAKLSGSKAEMKLYNRQVKGAVERGTTWQLTPDEFIEIVKKPCTYCGSEPLQRDRKLKLRYTGVDRLEPAQGYTLPNCVPCCGDCRQMKGSRNYVEFLDLVLKISKCIQNKIHP